MSSTETILREVIDAVPLGAHFWALNPDNSLTFEGANIQAEKILGIEHKKLIGLKIEDAFPAHRNGEIPEIYRRIARDGGHYEQETVDYKDGVISGCFEISAVQVRQNHMVVFFRDITEKKKAAIALENEKERLHVTLQSIGDGVIVTDALGRVTMMNAISAHLTGWSQSEAVGHPLLDVFHIINERTGKACENPVDKVLKTGQIVGLANHTALIAKDGTQRIIADSGSPIKTANGDILGVVLVFRDITEQTRIEESLGNSQRIESLGILAGGIAHDFNNLLSGIFGFINLAKSQIAKKNESKAVEYIDRSLSVYERARGLTQQLLTFSKGGKPVKRVVLIANVLRDAVHFALSGSSIKAELNILNEDPLCDIDATQIEQVFDNILLNAVQAMPMGGVVNIELKLLDPLSPLPVGLSYGRGVVCIRIKDQGVGIPIQYLAKIFDPFFTTKQIGSGLGLATAYSIVQKHDGVITVDSEPGHGATFSVYLPIAETTSLPTASNEAGVLGHGERVLVMDDEDFIRDIASELLREIGYNPECFSDGESACLAYEKALKAGKPFAFAILDLTIPGGMGGKEAAAKIRQIDRNAVLYASSGYSEDTIMSVPRDYGFNNSLKKPYRREDLVALLSSSGK